MGPFPGALLLGLATAAAAIRPVDPQGTVRGVVADPFRPRFLAALAEREVVVIDIATASVSARVPVPGWAGEMAIDPATDRLYVALTDRDDIGVIDLATLRFEGVIDLAIGSDPVGLVVGRPGRLYATSAEGLLIVDTFSGSQLYLGNPLGARSWYSSDLALSPDRTTLYSLTRGIGPASLYVIDVCDDSPEYRGEDCCHTCMPDNAPDFALSPDGTTLYVADSPTGQVRALSTEAHLHDTHTALAGEAQALALSADGRTLYVGNRSWGVVTVDTTTWLSTAVDPGAVLDEVVDRGLALSADESTLAVVTATGFDPDRVELYQIAGLPPNRGGLRARPLDAVTLEPIDRAGFYYTRARASVGWVDVEGGVTGLAPLAAGSIDWTLRASGHTDATGTTQVVAGQWTDLGDVVLPRPGSQAGPAAVCVSPPVAPGTTADVVIHGRGFDRAATVSITDPDVVLNSYTWRTWSSIDASVTVAASASDLQGAVRVTNPGGLSAQGTLLALAPRAPELPPSSVPLLLATKVAPTDVHLHFDPGPIDPAHDAARSYPLFRSAVGPARGWIRFLDAPETPLARELAIDPGGLSPALPRSALVLYRVSAENCGGDSGDYPTP